MFYHTLRPLLFAGDPERTHERVLDWVDLCSVIPGAHLLIHLIYGSDSPMLETSLWGHTLSNPIGLAAGFDKNARIIDALFSLGFGMVEVGSITPRPQPGNPGPRLFRLIEDRAIINRLGFNNEGLKLIQRRLERYRGSGILGVNLGKNSDTPLEEANGDYLGGMRKTHLWADYFCINISSPNTEYLRLLQEGEQLRRLLDTVCPERERLDEERGKKTPLLIKLAPDWEEGVLENSISLLRDYPLDSVIATNTSLARPDLKSRFRSESGGLSGAPIFEASTRVLRTLYQELDGRMSIIGVGGIFTAEDAYAKIRAGASAVQIYTSLIFEGPGVVHRIKRGLIQLLQRDGLKSIGEAVGLDAGRSVQD